MRLLVTASILLNALLLAALLVRSWSAQPSTPDKHDSVAGEPGQVSNPGSHKPILPRSSLGSDQRRWNEVAASDPAQFAAALRNWGCPEPIVRNLIAAEINRRFGSRKADLRRINDFWLDGDGKDAEVQRRTKLLIALEEERQSMLQDVLGIPWYRAPHMDDRNYSGADLGLLLRNCREEEQREVFMDVYIQGRLQFAIFQALHPDRNEPGLREAANDFSVAFAEQIDAVLDTGQREEVELLLFDTKYTDVAGETEHFGRQLEPAELREALRILKPDRMELFDMDDYGPTEKADMRSVEKSQELRALLGDQRFGEFLQRHQGEPTRGYVGSSEALPPPTTFLQLHELQFETLEKASAIRASWDTDPEETNAQLLLLLEETRLKMQNLAGLEYFTNYLSSGGQWLGRIVPPVRSK